MVEQNSCIVVDVGATSIRGGYADATAPLRSVPCPGAAAEVLAAIGEVVKSVQRESPERRMEVLSVGCPGLIEDGVVRQALYVPLTGVELQRQLEATLSVPVIVANDLSAQALGDAGVAAGSSFFAIGVGTAVGGAHVRNGVLQGRPAGPLGEVGHLPVSLTDERCRCGGSGCLDLYLSGAAIAGSLGPAWWLAEADGEQAAVLGRAGLALAQSVRALAVALDPDYVLLLGRVFANPYLWQAFDRGRNGLGSETPIAVARETWPHIKLGLLRLAGGSYREIRAANASPR